MIKKGILITTQHPSGLQWRGARYRTGHTTPKKPPITASEQPMPLERATDLHVRRPGEKMDITASGWDWRSSSNESRGHSSVAAEHVAPGVCDWPGTSQSWQRYATGWGPNIESVYVLFSCAFPSHVGFLICRSLCRQIDQLSVGRLPCVCTMVVEAERLFMRCIYKVLLRDHLGVFLNALL